MVVYSPVDVNLWTLAAVLVDGSDRNAPPPEDGLHLKGYLAKSVDPGTPQDGEALNTPGAENAAATTPTAILNEFVFNHVGEDTDEFIEVLGPPNTNLASLSIVLIEGDVFGGGEGRIDDGVV